MLPAFVAEMDFTVAEPISAAVRAALAIGDTGYPHVGELGEAFASFAAGRLGWTPEPDWVFAVPDVMTGIVEVLLATTPHGSGVVISPPVYGPFFFRLGFIGRRVVEAPLRRCDDGSYDLDLAVAGPRARPIPASAPTCCAARITRSARSGPATSCWPIADLCQRHDVVLLVDEIHAPLVMPDAKFVPFGSVDHPMAERAYVFTSASKGWNIAGLKCGIAVAGSEQSAAVLAERWEALLCSHLGLLGSVAAFSESVPWLDAAVAQIDENRALLGSPAARAAARGRLRSRRGDLPGLAGLPEPGPGRRPGGGLPGPRQGGAQPGAGLRQPGHRIRAAEHRHLARADRRGCPADGSVGLAGRPSGSDLQALAGPATIMVWSAGMPG